MVRPLHIRWLRALRILLACILLAAAESPLAERPCTAAEIAAPHGRRGEQAAHAAAPLVMTPAVLLDAPPALSPQRSAGSADRAVPHLAYLLHCALLL